MQRAGVADQPDVYYLDEIRRGALLRAWSLPYTGRGTEPSALLVALFTQVPSTTSLVLRYAGGMDKKPNIPYAVPKASSDPLPGSPPSWSPSPPCFVAPRAVTPWSATSQDS